MATLPVRGDGGARAGPAAAARPHAGAARRRPAQALALRGRLRAGADALRGRRPRRRRAAALVGGRRCRTARLFEGARRDPPARSIGSTLDEGTGVEVVSPHGRSYIWTRKQAGRRGARARCGWAAASCASTARSASSTSPPATTRGTPRGAGRPGIGVARDGRRGGLEPGRRRARRAARRASARCGSTASRTRWSRWSSPPTCRRWAGCASREWSAREDHTNRLVMRSDYRQPFGSFSGALPGGCELERGLRCDGVARRALVAAITAALLLAACGGGDSDDDGDAPARAAAAARRDERSGAGRRSAARGARCRR